MGRRPPAGQRAAGTTVTLSESDGVRYLHFGSVWVQGAMRIARPYALQLQYQQQMMAPLLFLREPRAILQLGLGAGALTKFCWRHLPGARITVVELSAPVVQAARRWFRLPADDERLQVVLGDARAIVSDPASRRRFDWVQVDLYDAAARGPVHDDRVFYAACRRALRCPGVAAFNLFGRSFDASLREIAAAFDDRILTLPESEGGNRIVLGFVGPPARLDARVLAQRADELVRALRLPAREWIRGLAGPLECVDGPRV